MKDNVDIAEKSCPTFEGYSCNCLAFKCMRKQAGLEELSLNETTAYVETKLPTSGDGEKEEARLQAEEGQKQWFVLRDLKRPNAKQPAYKQLGEEGIEVFTPMKWHLAVKQGKKVREEIPFIPDLLFVHDKRENLDLIVEKTPTLQYRYMRGKAYCEPLTVDEDDMQRFMLATRAVEAPCYYLPQEITKKMYGRKVRIVGGPLNGYEGCLLTTRGSKVKRLVVELPKLLFVSVEVSPEYIELLG